MTWREIPGWEGIYEASTDGEIRSMERQIVQGNRWGQRMICWRESVVLKQSPNSRGYLTVPLNGGGKRRTGVAVHHLIALTFLGQRPPGTHVCHGNGNRLDNRVTNLRYASARENVRDSIEHYGRHGRFPRMDIDESEVLRSRARGRTYDQLAGDFKIGVGTVGRILAGRRFRTRTQGGTHGTA